MSRLHIILVHGAYHQPWHMHLLKARLEEAGRQVSTPALPSAGHGAAATIGLQEDKAEIKLSMEKAGKTAESILPVFHSYSGIPGSEAVAELSQAAREKISRLVYLMAFVIDQGTAGITVAGGNLAPWSCRNGNVCSVPDPIPVFYNDVHPDLAQEAAKHLVEHSYRAFSDKTEHAGWQLYPAIYVLCTEDKALNPEGIRARVGMLKKESPCGFEVVEMRCGHSPFLSQPEETAAVIERAAGLQ